ncbi:hypothetical protein [Mycobacterium lepromatosis]|uniref:hypothetical protein n=1 Tax=Mycobacterium lepromatosis TaxID=480418 RepID=UPI000697146D|nr:hypothetical protein [Mycobacterium lepromatosis]
MSANLVGVVGAKPAILQWVTWPALGTNVAYVLHLLPWIGAVRQRLVALKFVLFVASVGLLGIAVLLAHILLWKVEPGTYPSVVSVYLCMWLCRATGRGQ